MASKIVVGEVIAKRIYELVTKLSGDIDTANDYLALDNQNDSETKKISLGAVATVLGALVAASSDDITPGFLDDKLVVETGLLKTILNPLGDEEIQIGLGRDDTFQLLNSADTSKVLKFLLSGITTGTTRTLTIPDKSGTIALQIYEPTTEPNIVTGTPNTLTLDMDSNRQAMFEPRLSSGTRTINVNFDLVISNQTNALLLSVVLSLTGTITIDMPTDVLVSNPSSIGTWDDTLKELELATGTDDIIELQFLRDKTGSKWLLKVSEIAT